MIAVVLAPRHPRKWRIANHVIEFKFEVIARLWEGQTAINLLLSDGSQFRAECTKRGVDLWLDEATEFEQALASSGVYQYSPKLNDLALVAWNLGSVAVTGSFEIDAQYVTCWTDKGVEIAENLFGLFE
ncbi:hypothetical protein D3C80_1423450 [compost metagenome]